MSLNGNNTEPRTKVAKLIKKYDMAGFGDELERMWTASGDERKSLRELAAIFNKRLLQSAVEQSEVAHLNINTGVDDIYLQLSGEEGTTADQTRIQRQLEREGIDVEALRSDFVSYGAIRSFLKEERNAEYDSSQNPVKRDRDTIQQLRNRTMVVTETKLNGLVENDEIRLNSHDITVDINVFCKECGRQYDVIEIFEQEGCGCQE